MANDNEADLTSSKSLHTLADYLTSSRAEFRNPSSKARLAYLYSDVSQAQTTNPTGFASTLSWWSSLISDVVSRGLQSGGGSPDSIAATDKLVWHINQDFAEGMRRTNVGRPSGLGTVTMALSRNTPAQLIPLKAFMASTTPIQHFSWPRWFVSKLVGAPLWWSLSKMGIVSGDNAMTEERAWKLAQGDWVVMDVMKKAADVITDNLRSEDRSILDRLYSRETFTAKFASLAIPGSVLTSLDVQVLVKYLSRDRKVLAVSGDIIRLQKVGEDGHTTITESERGILQVKTTNEALEQQISDLERRINERQKKISGYLRSNQKDLAISHLRSKKALQDLLTKRTLAHENLQTILIKIEAAATDVAVMSAYTAATASLKSLLAHPCLQREHVEATMDDLQEALADQKEIEDVVSDTAHQINGGEEAEDEVQTELRALEAEMQEEQEKANAARKLEERQRAEADRHKPDGRLATAQSQDQVEKLAQEQERQAIPA